MSEARATAVISADVQDHPAVKAWRALRPESGLPARVENLKEKGKSRVYRLIGGDLDGRPVIAKQCSRQTGQLERRIYQEILPELPILALEYHGLVENPEGDYCWGFMQDAGTVKPETREHRTLAARWLGLMHTSAASLAKGAQLRERGPSWHLRGLRKARDNICLGLSHKNFDSEHKRILKTAASQLDTVESRWAEFEMIWKGMPETLVHNDFHEWHVRIWKSTGGDDVLTFDWERAGWGIPVRDLAQIDVAAYWEAVHKKWDVDFDRIDRMANIAKIMRLVEFTEWASRDLDQWKIPYLSGYQAELGNQIKIV